MTHHPRKAMSLSLLVFLGFSLIVGLAAYAVLNIFTQEVKPGVRQGMEVALVDTAHLLAELAKPELQGGTLLDGRFSEAVQSYLAQRQKAWIWGTAKGKASFRVYVTDGQGIVRFDSAGEALGRDYSRWNDVYLTLRGQYGVRSTRTDPRDETTSHMHVAAPIQDGNHIIGVLTVASPTAPLWTFAHRSQQRVLRAGFLLMGTALLVGLGLAAWLSRSIGRLRRYAREAAEGRRTPLPRTGGGELRDLALALETMRNRLEDRAYVERTVANLTHEMKSPLAAIRGAAELLLEPMPEADRHHFATNIREQGERLQLLVERMLALAAVQQRQGLQAPGPLDLRALVDRVVASRRTLLQARHLVVASDVATGTTVRGETFLLEQCLANLLDNAIAFSPEGGTVRIAHAREEGRHVLSLRDQGPGIPDFALPRVFEPFYSLAHPDTGRKSTGLGLSFAREVAQLHGGSLDLGNSPEGGAVAVLRLPP